MGANAGVRADPDGWEVARPGRPGRAPGADMAGFGVPGSLADGLRVVPHPAVMLVLEFGARPSVVEVGAGESLLGSVVAGPGFGAGGAVRARGESVACVQVRLSPLVAHAVLGAPPGELGDGAVASDALWGREAVRLRERLGEAAGWPERFALTDAALARRIAQARRRVDPEVARAWRRITAGGGRVRVDGLAAEVGWSRKRLWQRFRAQLGMGPKQAATLVRFDAAAHRLVAGTAPARVAAECGYADQSHLHREVAAFAGVTPSALTTEPFLTVDPRAWPTTTRP